MTSSRRALGVAALVLTPVLALTGCSSSSSAAPGGSTGTASASPSTSVAALTADMVKVTGGIKDVPTVTFPVPSQAAALSTTDLVVGTGAEVKATDTITVNYVGIGALSGKEFDSSYKRGAPATFPLAGLIPGWQKGIPGMKVGGRRVLVIPGDLAYGPQPPSGDIQPNETLVFVMDVLKVG